MSSRRGGRGGESGEGAVEEREARHALERSNGRLDILGQFQLHAVTMLEQQGRECIAVIDIEWKVRKLVGASDPYQLLSMMMWMKLHLAYAGIVIVIIIVMRGGVFLTPLCFSSPTIFCSFLPSRHTAKSTFELLGHPVVDTRAFKAYTTRTRCV